MALNNPGTSVAATISGVSTAANQATEITALSTLNTSVAAVTTAINATTTALNAKGVYPTAAVPITASSGNVAAASAVATLAGASAKTTYITGFIISGAGATVALPVLVTVTGVVTGTLTFVYTAIAGVLLGNQPLIVTFPFPIPASATNTAIVVTCPSLGLGNTNNSAVAFGYQL